MRDITLEDTFYHDFTTRSFSTGVPTTLAGSPVLSVLEENNATPITAGVSVSVDRATVTGLNEATIVATAANGYESGKSYSIYISTGTVGGVSVVGEVVGQFTIEASAAAVDLANATDGLGAIKAETASILVDTAEIGTAGAGLTNINLPDQTMNITGNITGNLSGSVGSLTGHTNQTADHTANIAAILVDTGTTLDTKLNDIQGATFSSVTDSLEAIRDRGDAAWTTGAGGSDRLLMVDTTIATLATQTSFTLTAGSADDDAYNNCTIVVEDVSTSTQKAVGMVLDYTGSTKTVTLKEALAFTIATTDKVYILAENALKSTVANRQLDVTATGAAGIDWNNIENPTTAVDLSGTDIQLCDTVTTNTDMRGTDSAATAASLATAQADLDIITGADGVNLLSATQASIDAIETDTNSLNDTKIPQTLNLTALGNIGIDWANVENPTTALDLSATDIQLCDTITTYTGNTVQTGDSFARLGSPAGASVSADVAALNNISVSDILTTQMTESYAADGTAPTLAQALCLIQQSIGDFAISGTTVTVKKLDGSTTAATYTLDDGTNPTSRTRST